MEIGFVLHNLIFLVERAATAKPQAEATARPLAATKSEARISKSETNSNDQKQKIKTNRNCLLIHTLRQHHLENMHKKQSTGCLTAEVTG